EPLSALDARLRDEIRDELLRLLTDLSITTVYVTHDQVEAMTLAHEMVILNKGRVEQTGQPMDVYRRPANIFVANFLGHANIFRATCETNGAALHVRLPFGAIEVSSRQIPAGRCMAMIRPEDIEVVSHANGADFSASVESCAFLGDRFRIALRAGGVEFFAETQHHLVVTPGSRVGLQVNAQKLLLWPQLST
ncbi:MAG: ABC transporter ATP-binding protein, partial [Verrucomicrobiota bacterium]|nr:ABC transporter ATP-binding protein [Verrucomicrobiota bacterium]